MASIRTVREDKKPIVRSSVSNDVDHLVNMGEKALLETAANTVHDLHKDQIRIKKINVGMTELSHLHAQLNSINTQSTLIVGFAVSSLGADSLAELADNTGQFCIYKSVASKIVGFIFINVGVFCILNAFTVITCATAITTWSNRRCFDYPDTHHVVRAVQKIMYGDTNVKLPRWRDVCCDPAMRRPVRHFLDLLTQRYGIISFCYNAAFLSFFISTASLLWLFLITDNYVRLTPFFISTVSLLLLFLITENTCVSLPSARHLSAPDGLPHHLAGAPHTRGQGGGARRGGAAAARQCELYRVEPVCYSYDARHLCGTVYEPVRHGI